jgi:predicted porin
MSGFSGAIAFTTDLNVTQTYGTAGSTTATTASGDRENANAWNLNAAYENGPIYVGFGYGDGDYHENNGLEETWRLAGAFSFGDFKVVGQYDAQGSTSGNDFDAWMIGGAFQMGAMTFKANYMDGEYDLAADPEQWTLGVDYAMSKRTSVYALYVGGENITLGKGGSSSDQVGSGVSGGDIAALSFGVVHNF